MQLTVSNESTEQVYGPIDVSDDMVLDDLLALLELDCSFDGEKQDLYNNMAAIDVDGSRAKTLKELGIQNSQLLLIKNKSESNIENLNDRDYVEAFRRQLLANQLMRQQLSFQIPGLDNIINDPRLFFERLSPIILQRRGGSPFSAVQNQNDFGIPQGEYEKLMKDPENPENKKRLAELTDQKAIDEQLRYAYEFTPEVFTTVSMLFINLEINGHPVKAFVDTGAQMTMMSTKLAELTGLTRLIDRRFIGEARGVGTGKILGRIHQAQLKIETQYIPGSFAVLDTGIDLLFGLDMLRRHQAIIDLKDNVMKIAGVETKFLTEADIPKSSQEEIIKKAGGPSGVIQGTGSTVPSNAPTTINSQQQGGISHSEAAINQLMDLGFTRTEVIKALDMTGGNAELAASYLFQ
ncbi:Ddi1p KNAG_0G01580 [Huiozyma naganishii CBS 8797]|uniref:DNA damage-inducible protein 1 n=1 Tax=Huiozyma naganishii (strain ATCC MYA-139 / BCRC 22969 / CBS 8797 / KCTC 17520 / NBRC 10181 / NCYC 3082 / Yp74L-3) TaxID=1071383 RepID=J7S904_HUIN7|nr:hypothetical protein KNAG_0G01580 [Kazachstania naganishii CBS 8797]CCK71216.1 hypothetical protein KNAG_0G01580 [Kazachstania naganishii CBS 8797]